MLLLRSGRSGCMSRSSRSQLVIDYEQPTTTRTSCWHTNQIFDAIRVLYCTYIVRSSAIDASPCPVGQNSLYCIVFLDWRVMGFTRSRRPGFQVLLRTFCCEALCACVDAYVFEWHAERSLSNDVLCRTKKTHGALRKVSQFAFLVLAGREKNQAPWRPCLLN